MGVNFLLALSTCWQSSLTQSGRDLIGNIKSMGFDEIELEYRVTQEMYPEIASALRSENMRPVSIHNFFPAPEVAPQPGGDVWAFSSGDPDERAAAVDYTKRSIDIAGELGASVLVLHCGHVPIDPHTAELRELFD